MSAAAAAAAVPETAAPTVDDRNPWLGLASFTEETRGYFYGREEEVAELSRRVQRKLLTVLFGQSGLGKTSILRAGLVPRLRLQGYCPIYVRIAYGRDAPEPAEQIKQAIARTARRSGQWTQQGVAVAGETLWEFLHHRDDVLRDESGATLIPLLIFDQFEEIFTLAQSDDFGRARAARFVADLADLVENRPPKELEARLETDDSAAEQFDFARSDYRVLIALREDYLAPLESLKVPMPSITQNRLRLAPMTGQQALAAVMRPGKQLVSEEVAAAIVRFVAGGAELANAEVEPSLLSLICRELNDTRLAEGRAEISLDLLAGSHATILTNFYERSLADQPPAVRRIIEDELLTASGFRENVAEERLLSSFAAAGAAPDTLATLVNRRLLRIEERLDVRRVELTHDVLCNVVKASRDVRQEREARDAAEQLLNEQRERARTARRAMIRARQVAIGCAVLAVGALLAAGYAYVSTQRARRAEQAAVQASAAADQTRFLADQARGQAEQLLGYLSDDFSRELESFGRLDLVAELARRQMDYFKALPAELKGDDTSRNGAQAMVQYAKASRTMGRFKEAGDASAEALQLLEKLRQSGDTSEQTTISYALATMVQAMVLDDAQKPEALPTLQRAVDTLRPIAEAPKASLEARRAYVQTLNRYGYKLARSFRYADALPVLDRCLALAAGGGALDLSAPDLSAEYLMCGAWKLDSLIGSGRPDEARRLGATASDLAARLLRARPNFLAALRGEDLISGSLSGLAQEEMRLADAIRMTERARAATAALMRLDPGNSIAQHNLLVSLEALGDSNWQLGRPREALRFATDPAFQAYRSTQGHTGASFLFEAILGQVIHAVRQTEVGDAAAAAESMARAEADYALLRKAEPDGSLLVVLSGCRFDYAHSMIALYHGDRRTGLTRGRDCLERAARLQPRGSQEEVFVRFTQFFGGRMLGEIEYADGDWPGAERTLRATLATRARWPLATNFDRREQAEAETYLAMALARQGRQAEALALIGPVLTLQRGLATRNHDDQWQHVELAAALYARSLADPAARAALLAEAAGLVGSVPAEMQALYSVRVWRERIAGAESPANAAAAGPAPPRDGG